MKRAALCSLLILVTTLSGCVVAIGNKGGTSTGSKPCKNRPASSGTYAEIDAAGRLMMEDSKMNVYRTIAKRDLTVDERTYLIDSAMKNLMMENNKEEILMTLAKKPPVCDEPQPQPVPAPEPAQEQ